MANELIRLQDLFPATLVQDRKLSRELARQIKHMVEIREVAEAAMDEVSAVTTYGAFKGASALTMANLIHQAAKAQGITLSEDAAYEHLTQEFLRTLSHIVNSANTKIVIAVDQLPADAKNVSVLQEWLDSLLGS